MDYKITGHRPEWFLEASKGRSVLDIAADVSSGCRGSLQYNSQEELDNDIKCLKQVINDWREDNHRSWKSWNKFDNLVKQLIEEALVMAGKDI